MDTRIAPSESVAMDTTETVRLQRRLRRVTGTLIAGLVASGITALPIPQQFRWAAARLGDDFRAGGRIPNGIADWLVAAWRGIEATDAAAPFIWYGTDWLAFGHFVIAASFIGAWRDPIRNRWLFQFALIACMAVIPWALAFGALRGIPPWWRLVDSTFGILGGIPAYLGHRWAGRLECIARSAPATAERVP